MVAYDGEAAAAALEAETFDVLISDVVMPVSGAIVLAALARLRQPAIRVIAVTGSLALRDSPLDEAVEGADLTLRKPIDLETLVAAVREALRAAAA
jgi:CheY-like chemotaxis protein